MPHKQPDDVARTLAAVYLGLVKRMRERKLSPASANLGGTSEAGHGDSQPVSGADHHAKLYLRTDIL